MRKKLNNVLLISGSGRNSGKTTLACHIIRQVSVNCEVIAIKISPHFHYNKKSHEQVVNSEKFNIFQEKNADSGKDSSRMLASGATEVYFVEAEDEGVQEAVSVIIKKVGKEKPIVCESGSLSHFYISGYHIMAIGDNPDFSKKSFSFNFEKAQLKLNKEDFSTEKSNLEAIFEEGFWKVKRLY